MEADARAALRAAMVRLADGDRSAFDPVFEAASTPVRRLTVRMLGDCAEAEDAAQEALLKVFARAGDYDPERDALAWILGIAAYECRTARKRRARRREELGAETERPSAQGSPEDDASRRELYDAVLQIVGELSASDAETLAASLDPDRRAALAVGAATFRKRLQRALARVRNAWSKMHGEG